MFESTNFHKGKLFCNNCKRFSKWYDNGSTKFNKTFCCG